MRRILPAVLLAAALGAREAAALGASEAGATAAPFLRMGADARAAGMGGAVRASAEDASAVYWNPAGLARLRYRHASFTHSAAYQNTFHDFLAYAQPLEGRAGNGRERDLQPDQLGAFGAAVLYHNSGALQEIDNAGTPTGRDFSPQDYAAIVAWGAELAAGVDGGIAVKYVSSKIESSAATGAADAGLRWRTPVAGLEEADYALSASVHNVGGQIRFHEVSDPLPLTFALGQALHLFRRLTIGLDLTAPRDRAMFASFGAEWRAPMVKGVWGAVRAGYDGSMSGGPQGTTGVCLGGGLGFERLSFDFAWTPAGELGQTQRVSLGYRF